MHLQSLSDRAMYQCSPSDKGVCDDLGDEGTATADRRVPKLFNSCVVFCPHFLRGASPPPNTRKLRARSGCEASVVVRSYVTLLAKLFRKLSKPYGLPLVQIFDRIRLRNKISCSKRVAYRPRLQRTRHTRTRIFHDTFAVRARCDLCQGPPPRKRTASLPPPSSGTAQNKCLLIECLYTINTTRVKLSECNGCAVAHNLADAGLDRTLLCKTLRRNRSTSALTGTGRRLRRRTRQPRDFSYSSATRVRGPPDRLFVRFRTVRVRNRRRRRRSSGDVGLLHRKRSGFDTRSEKICKTPDVNQRVFMPNITQVKDLIRYLCMALDMSRWHDVSHPGLRNLFVV
ncbi:hypothetical protein EVAR_99788_1 [Eumeta japonica]|uniref:Uncharacterized protein n=1 Tax=Eumeta variegata TaxID=151549 RepID=A0A4C1ZAR8_EUMVA|nr:hypothetical protein EVAR_99788_1 [Eumeta japonica]